MNHPAKPERIGRVGQAITGAEREFRLAIAGTFRGIKRSRQEVSETMTQLAGQPITESMLNDFSAISKRTARFPGWFLAPFCRATNDTELILVALGEYANVFRLGEIVTRLIDERTRKLLLADAERKRGKGK